MEVGGWVWVQLDGTFFLENVGKVEQTRNCKVHVHKMQKLNGRNFHFEQIMHKSLKVAVLPRTPRDTQRKSY